MKSFPGLLLAASVTVTLFTGPGCGTDAHGVEECRSIELARCTAASHCPLAQGVPVIGNVSDCRRFYRDHCLHGTASTAPSAGAVNACVDAIRAAGDCASAGTDLEMQFTLCASPQTPEAACEAILKPELFEACRFLSDTEISDTEAQGGSPGTTLGGANGSGAPEGGSVGAGASSAN